MGHGGIGASVHQCSGASVQRCSGAWCMGALVHWGIGALVHRCGGALHRTNYTYFTCTRLTALAILPKLAGHDEVDVVL